MCSYFKRAKEAYKKRENGQNNEVKRFPDATVFEHINGHILDYFRGGNEEQVGQRGTEWIRGRVIYSGVQITHTSKHVREYNERGARFRHCQTDKIT